MKKVLSLLLMLFFFGGIWIGFANNMGISIDTQSPVKSSFDIKKALWIKKWDTSETKVFPFFQDIILGATMFIGTVVSIALIASGLMYIFSSVDSGLKAKAKKWIISSIIGLVLVSSALLIIRLVQFLAMGGS